MKIQYMLNAAAYLRLKGSNAADPVFIPQDTIVGEDTPYDFEGPPTPFMTPLNDRTAEVHNEYLASIGSGIPQTVKGGAGQPFDPADPNSNSKAEKDEAEAKQKAKEDELNAKFEQLSKMGDALEQRLAALDKREKELADRESKVSAPDKAPEPAKDTGGKPASSATSTQNKS